MLYLPGKCQFASNMLLGQERAHPLNDTKKPYKHGDALDFFSKEGCGLPEERAQKWWAGSSPLEERHLDRADPNYDRLYTYEQILERCAGDEEAATKRWNGSSSVDLGIFVEPSHRRNKTPNFEAALRERKASPELFFRIPLAGDLSTTEISVSQPLFYSKAPDGTHVRQVGRMTLAHPEIQTMTYLHSRANIDVCHLLEEGQMPQQKYKADHSKEMMAWPLDLVSIQHEDSKEKEYWWRLTFISPSKSNNELRVEAWEKQLSGKDSFKKYLENGFQGQSRWTKVHESLKAELRDSLVLRE